MECYPTCASRPVPRNARAESGAGPRGVEIHRSCPVIVGEGQHDRSVSPLHTQIDSSDPEAPYNVAVIGLNATFKNQNMDMTSRGRLRKQGAERYRPPHANTETLDRIISACPRIGRPYWRCHVRQLPGNSHIDHQRQTQEEQKGEVDGEMV